jgi:hypothetical protein
MSNGLSSVKSKSKYAKPSTLVQSLLAAPVTGDND